MSAAVHNLSPLSIVESKTNPRKHFDEAYIARLTDSIKKVGILQPLVVRPKGDGYELVAGHCRLRAAKAALVKMVPVSVRELTDVEALEVQLFENLHRADLHPLEEAAGYRALMAKPHKYTAARIAESTGRSVKYIYDRVKLLELTKEAQQLFLDDRITAGHAILLARLSAKDQERAIGGESRFGEIGGLFSPEHRIDWDGEGDPPRKPVSVRGLEGWIDQHVRFDRTKIEPVLFPETAAAVETSTKVIAITHEYRVQPEAKDAKERTYGPMSWERADGKEQSKACEFSVLGVISVGTGRGHAFDVCVNKDKCKTHWSKEMAAKARAAKQREKGGAKPAKPAGKPSWQIEEEKRKAKAAAWEKVVPAVLDAFAAAVAKAPTKATGLLARIILDKLYIGRGAKDADKLIPLGATAEDFVRHVALQILSSDIHDTWSGPANVPKLGKAFGIDVAAIVKAATPKVPAAKKGAKKGTPGVCRECGCTDDNCDGCVERTGGPCSWVEKDLCSACVPPGAESDKPAKKRKAS